MLNGEIRRLMKDLGESINETLGESPRINESIQNIRDAGYEIFLIIEAKIGFNRRAGSENESLVSHCRKDDPVHLRLTSEDAKFLKSLKISVDSDS